MLEKEIEYGASKARADAILESAARYLKEILHELVAQLDPFPAFPDALFTYGIEIEPSTGTNRDRGCVVIRPDGEFYEFSMGIEPSGAVDLITTRHEETKKIDLTPQEYIPYAYEAIYKITGLLIERQKSGKAEAQS